MEVVVLDTEGDVIARGSYFGGPDYEFVVAADRQVYFRVVGDTETAWAGPDAESFRRIAAWRDSRPGPAKASYVASRRC